MPDKITKQEIAQQIALIGQRMVSCRLYCGGISLDPTNGILPRALVFETDARSSDDGSIVLGINPGTSFSPERDYYMQHGATYDVLLKWHGGRPRLHRYELRLKRFLSALELNGPILWTELVKCENHPSSKRALPPIATIRACVNRHLMPELSTVPTSWPIIAAGRKPYELAAIMFPNRKVLGVPHPTGSFGDKFGRLFEKDQLQSQFRKLAQNVLTNSEPLATWIADI